MLSRKGRNEIAWDLKEKWESQYFNDRRLGENDWYSSEKTYSSNNKTNGGRTLYNAIITEHARNRRYEIGQGPIKILTTVKYEIDEIEKELGDIGLIKYLKNKYNLEIDQIKTTCTKSFKREIEIVLIEKNDEGCVGGDDLLKEEDRLNLKWR